MGMFKPAERTKAFLKMAISGSSGSGKTYSALRLARGLIGKDGRIAVLDTENRSATLYADLTNFDHCSIVPSNGKFEYTDFVSGIKAAEREGYDCVIIDSASHFWQGLLAWKTEIDKHGGNQYTNWADPSRAFNDVINAILQAKLHVIFCMRSKMDYVLEDNDRGKKVPVKVGLAPVMRDGAEYEFTIHFDVYPNHLCCALKDRTGLFSKYDAASQQWFQITEETGAIISSWLAGAKPEDVAQAIVPHTAPPPAEHEPATIRKEYGKKQKKEKEAAPEPTKVETVVAESPEPTETQPAPETVTARETEPETEPATAKDEPANAPEVDRETLKDLIQQNVKHGGNAGGVVSFDEYKAYCKAHGVDKASDLPYQDMYALADHIGRVVRATRLITETKANPILVSQTLTACQAKSLFTMTPTDLERFTSALYETRIKQPTT